MGLLQKLNLKTMENLQAWGVPNLVRYCGGWSPFPVGILLMLTLRCNLKCAMCLLAEHRAGGAELTLDELKALVDDLAASFRFKAFIHLTGGEPLLRHDVLDLLVHIKSRGFSCSLTTNGLLLEQHAEALVQSGLDRLQVSLDGPPEIHDQVRGMPGAHARALAGIRAVTAARRKSGFARPTVTVNTVVSRTNLDHLGDMIPIARADGADALSYQHLVFSACAGPDTAAPDIDRLLAELPRLKQQAREAGLPITFYPRMSDRQLRVYYAGNEKELSRKCVFPWYVVRVDTTGGITPCRGFVVENVRGKEGSFRRVWNSKRFRDYRRTLARQGVFEDCGRCCHRQYTGSSS